MYCQKPKIYTVSIIGHRYVDDHGKTTERLARALQDLFKEHDSIEFLVGRNGEFDEIAASEIRRQKRSFGEERCYLTLVLPYPVANVRDYEQYYDDVIYPNDDRLHFKRAIQTRNEWMINQCDLLLAYIEKNSGNSYKLFLSAQEKGVPVLKI